MERSRWRVLTKTQSAREGNSKPLQHSCLENAMNSMKRQKDMTLRDDLPKSVGAHYAPGEEQRHISRRNEEAEPKQEQDPVVMRLVVKVKSVAIKNSTA